MIERNDLSYTADDEGARIVEPQFSAEDTDVEFSLRPRKLNEYIGQEKVKENLSQASLNYILRQENIKDCFAVRKEYRGIIRGATVLLIDDIFTTGATCNEVSRILKLAGVEKVYVLTLAHTGLEKRF